MALLHPSASNVVPAHGASSTPWSLVPRASSTAALTVTLWKDQGLCGVSKALYYEMGPSGPGATPLRLRPLWASGLCSPQGAMCGRTRREASRTDLALHLGFLGGSGGYQAVDHVLQLLIALHQRADLVAQVQAAGWAGCLRANLTRYQGCRGLLRGHAHGQQCGRRGQHVLDDRPELVQLGTGETAGAGQ